MNTGPEQEFTSGDPDHEFSSIVRSCHCHDCKNYFWVPSDGKFGEKDAEMPEHLLPRFCPFCGVAFDLSDVQDMTSDEVKEMKSLIESKPETE